MISNASLGFNRYIPPHYDGKRSLNSLAGKNHGLGNRGRKASQGILIVRFEAPFSFSCDKCHVSIAQGQRFNAEKKKVGYYFSTPVWSFKIKCRDCSNPFEIRTDPKNTRYIIESGGTKKSTAEDENDVTTPGASFPMNRALDNSKNNTPKPYDMFATLEQEKSKNEARLSREREIEILYERNVRRWRDSYAVSRKLRDKFRREKQSLEKQERATQKLKNKMSLFIQPATESDSDVQQAKSQQFSNGIAKNETLSRDSILTSGLFYRTSMFSLKTIQEMESPISTGASTPSSSHKQRAVDRWRFKEEALKKLATEVDKSSDPFYASAANVTISTYIRPKNSRFKEGKRQESGLVNYSDSE